MNPAGADSASGLVPLIVRAHLAAGIAHASPWGIALDGILASELWADLKARQRQTSPDHLLGRALQHPNPPDLNLPLARCIPASGPWHWAATFSFPCDPTGRPVPPGMTPDVHTWSGRVDHRALEQVADKLPRIVSQRQGRYRARLMPLLVTICSSISWHAIGDPDRITQILTPITSLGKKRSTGEGHVLAWTITQAPDLTDFTAAHLHPDGTLGRPTPPACLSLTDPAPADGGRGLAGIRPPYMHTSRAFELHLPATDSQRPAAAGTP